MGHQSLISVALATTCDLLNTILQLNLLLVSGTATLAGCNHQNGLQSVVRASCWDRDPPTADGWPHNVAGREGMTFLHTIEGMLRTQSSLHEGRRVSVPFAAAGAERKTFTFLLHYDKER